jgi:hypothetical protein
VYLPLCSTIDCFVNLDCVSTALFDYRLLWIFKITHVPGVVFLFYLPGFYTFRLTIRREDIPLIRRHRTITTAEKFPRGTGSAFYTTTDQSTRSENF